MDYEFAKNKNGAPILKVRRAGYALVLNPLMNKGMAFSNVERETFGLLGILPPGEVDLSIQLSRSYEAFQSKSSLLEKYIYLRDLQDSNETLFYSLLLKHINEMLPIVYTPVVGLGCQNYSHIYRRPRGIFIAYPYKDQINKIFASSKFDAVKVIVVSDGERILGLGDQGAGGMGISVGKLALYSACAGIYPGFTLPILLDTGTDNESLQNDPLYIGWKHARVRDDEYMSFIDQFVSAVKKRFPHILLHWEDFSRLNAQPLLDRYRNQLCTFNDDIQGTAAVTLGTLLAAIRATGKKLSEHKIVIFGAGSAGCGIARYICLAMENEGLSHEQSLQNLFLIDRDGLLQIGQSLMPFQCEFARTNIKEMPFEQTIREVNATVLIGVSGQAGAFTEAVVRQMASQTPHPIIFPLSNPDSHAEAKPIDLLNWTEGRVIVGTGSPFAPVSFLGKGRVIDQTNNCYIFPGVGLALIALKAKSVPDSLMMAAAYALADCSSVSQDNFDSKLLPDFVEIREVSLKIALAVAKQIIAEGLTDVDVGDSLENYLQEYMWDPIYLPYEKV